MKYSDSRLRLVEDSPVIMDIVMDGKVRFDPDSFGGESGV